jgi:hypothetical protein
VQAGLNVRGNRVKVIAQALWLPAAGMHHTASAQRQQCKSCKRQAGSHNAPTSEIPLIGESALRARCCNGGHIIAWLCTCALWCAC